MSNRGRLRNALAIATRCFSPPLSFRPRSPTMVEYCSGMPSTVLCREASREASWTSSSVAVGLCTNWLMLTCTRFQNCMCVYT